jgi:hypothetical protein
MTHLHMGTHPGKHTPHWTLPATQFRPGHTRLHMGTAGITTDPYMATHQKQS